MGFSDFVGAAGCVLGGKCDEAPPPTPTQVAKILSDIQVDIEQSCVSRQQTRQEVTCPIIANGCSNLRITCGAEAQQSFSCTGASFDALLEKAAKTIVTAVGDNKRTLAAVKKDMAGAAADGTYLDSTTIQYVKEYLATSCTSQQSANQMLRSALLCNTSDNVTATFLSSVDQSTACMLVKANEVARDALGPTQAAVSSSGVAYVLFGIGILLLLLLACAVFFAARGHGAR
jgi:hypothetical protein